MTCVGLYCAQQQPHGGGAGDQTGARTCLQQRAAAACKGVCAGAGPCPVGVAVARHTLSNSAMTAARSSSRASARWNVTPSFLSVLITWPPIHPLLPKSRNTGAGAGTGAACVCAGGRGKAPHTCWGSWPPTTASSQTSPVPASPCSSRAARGGAGERPQPQLASACSRGPGRGGALTSAVPLASVVISLSASCCGGLVNVAVRALAAAMWRCMKGCSCATEAGCESARFCVGGSCFSCVRCPPPFRSSS